MSVFQVYQTRRLLPKACRLALFVSVLPLCAHADIASENTPPVSLCTFNTDKDAWECPQSNTQSQLDWISKALLTPETQQRLNPGCTGAYIDPLASEITDSTAMNALPLIIESDESEVTEGGNYASLSGDVRVSQGPRSIAAESMAYDRLKDEASLNGNVTIRQPGMLIRGSNASVSTIEQNGKFTDARFVMHGTHMRGSASSIEQNGPDIIILKEGAITSCEPGSNAWSLQGEELKINNATGQGFGKNVKLKLGSVPVFYLPYLTFPVGDERRSGFLFPSISSSDNGGLDIAAPYYFNLAPNYDLTLTPRLITGRGAMIESEFRHMNQQFESTFSAAFLSNDDGGNSQAIEDAIANGTASESELKPYKGNDRWLIQMQQTGGRREGWYSNIDYTRVSDEDYFRDLGTSSFAVANTTYLNQSIDVGTLLDHWNINLRAQDYQTLLLNLDAPYRKTPQFTADGFYYINGVKAQLSHQVTRFDHQDELRLNGSSIITGERAFIDYRLSTPWENSGAYIVPEIGHKALYYNFRVAEGDTLNVDNASLNASQASLNAGFVLENPGGKFLQTIEPRAFYLFREYEDHTALYDTTANGQSVNFDTSARAFSYGQLYRDSRFSGSDRLDDANQVTIGLTNRWFSHTDGHEFFNFSFGRINHFRDRRIDLANEISATQNTSELALEFGVNWRNGSSLYGGVVYDDDAADQTNRFSAGYNYASQDQLTLYSFGYSFIRENPEDVTSEQLDQINAAFIAPVSPQWYIMGSANYDIENSQELETFLGFEYNDCCYRFRLLARRWLDSNIANVIGDRNAAFDNGIFFEIQLKGLGGSGAKINSILEDAIPGYRRREQILNKR